MKKEENNTYGLIKNKLSDDQFIFQHQDGSKIEVVRRDQIKVLRNYLFWGNVFDEHFN